MTVEVVSCEELERTREDLVKCIKAAFTNDDKEFVLSIKRGAPKWSLLGIPDVDKLPAVQWKLQNIQKLEEAKRNQLIEQLVKVLE